MEEAQVSAVRASVRVFIATSLDGFIAREDGRIDWLEQANRLAPPGEDCGFGAFFAKTDVLVMGRKTFETVLDFPEWPYGTKPVVVVTHRPDALVIPEKIRSTVSATSETPGALVSRLAAQGMKELYIDGGALIRSFLAADLIDEITVTQIPVLIGSGLPLWGGDMRDRWLRLVQVKHFDFGFVQLRYERAAAQ
jgi:dihydrofolate reductase